MFLIFFIYVESMPVMILWSLSSSEYREAMLSSDKNRMTSQFWLTKRR